MKKFLSLICVCLLMINIVACTDTPTSQPATQSTSQIKASENSLNETTSENFSQSSETVSEDQQENEYYFKDNVLLCKDFKIVITDWKVIPAGESGNEYGDSPVIAFWYDTTNLSGSENISPMMSWIEVFTAIQDNDPNLINTLDSASHPDDSLLDNQLVAIKKDGTVSNAMAYVLTDETTPVILKATNGLFGEDLGEQTFEIK